jgi:hypothetical protein
MGNTGYGAGSVAIYANASGTPIQYTDAVLKRALFCSYDDRGNLFVDGFTRKGFGLAELPKGSSTFSEITLTQSIYFPGGVEWHGRYLAVGDQDVSKVYQFAIKDKHAVLEGTTRLDRARDVVQFWLVQKKSEARAGELVAPDAYNHDVSIYNYPAGGSPTSTFSCYFMYEPVGAAVSPDQALIINRKFRDP